MVLLADEINLADDSGGEVGQLRDPVSRGGRRRAGGERL
jgi:hypothetical protein